MTTKAELEADNATLQAGLDAAKAELDGIKAAHKAEIRAIKTKVNEVAQKYTKRHGWCDVVNAALAEAGMGRTYKTVEVEMVLPTSYTIEVDAEEYEEMDEEQRKTLIAGSVSFSTVLTPVTDSVRVGRAHATGTEPAVQAITESKVIGMSATRTPAGYEWMFTSNEGRVQHLTFPTNNAYSRNRRSALCGAGSTWTEWTIDSDRSEGRRCERCERAANNM